MLKKSACIVCSAIVQFLATHAVTNDGAQAARRSDAACKPIRHLTFLRRRKRQMSTTRAVASNSSIANNNVAHNNAIAAVVANVVFTANNWWWSKSISIGQS